MAAAARAAHEKLGIPSATIHVNPWQIRSVYRSPTMPLPMMMYDWVPKISKRLQYGTLDRLVLNPFADSPINAFRRDIGLPAYRGHLGAHYHSPQRIIGLFPDWWAEPQPDWPSQTVCTGFPLWDRGGVKPPPQELIDFLDDGDPPVVLFAGTVRQDARRLFEAGLEACRQLGRRTVLLTKHRDLLPRSLPSSAAAFEYVPFGYLLPRSAAMVHHAGIGTTSQGLLAGIPHVAMPRGNGPPFTAHLLKRHGVGQILYPKAMNASALTRCLQRLLSDPATEQNCRRIADRLKDEKPIDRACDELEALAGTDVPDQKTKAA
jgi:UDP:flavonoid glycosyltransferase YjiC (YdhE family)